MIDTITAVLLFGRIYYGFFKIVLFMQRRLSALEGLAFGDKGYIGKKLFDEFCNSPRHPDRSEGSSDVGLVPHVGDPSLRTG